MLCKLKILRTVMSFDFNDLKVRLIDRCQHIKGLENLYSTTSKNYYFHTIFTNGRCDSWGTFRCIIHRVFVKIACNMTMIVEGDVNKHAD